LDGGANPRLFRNTKFLQRPDPSVTEIGRRVILVITFGNLRPATVLLNEEFGLCKDCADWPNIALAARGLAIVNLMGN
jgi:hypothetical protein